MRWLSLVIVFAFVAPVHAQENDAEKLYRAMERRVRSTQTLHLTFTGEAVGGGQKAAAKGTVYVAEGNKGRIEVEVDAAGNTIKVLFISDGKNKYSKEGDQVKVEPNERKDSAKALAVIARIGMTPALVFHRPENKEKDKEEFDIDKEVPVKNFKLGAKEMIGKRQAQIVEYDMTIIPGVEVKAAVWIDTETELPLKRTILAEGKDAKVFVAETFGTFEINPKLDAKVFEIPK
jgi:outer membrane lipoprotein-sorting protein